VLLLLTSGWLLERVEGDTLLLRGTDLIDGTPILDIKPVHQDIPSVLLLLAHFLKWIPPCSCC